MNITAPQIALIVNELAGPLKSAFLNRLFQTDRDEWVIEFRSGGEKLWLLISVSPRHGRMHLVSGPPEARVTLDSFSTLLKKTLTRRAMENIEQRNDDRVVALSFGGHTLIAELMGPSGNLYLLDGEGKVIAVALSRKTRNPPGAAYTPPPPLHQKATDETPPPEGGPLAFNRELERRYEGPVHEDRLQQARSRALAPLRAELKRTRKRLASLEKERARLLTYEEHRRLADLLQANFGRIEKGAASIDVEDLFAPDNGTVTIELDPSLSPENNVKRYYRRYRKYERGLPRIEDEIAGLEAARREIERKKEEITSAASLDRLAAHLPVTARKPQAGKKKERQYSGPRRFVSSDGHPILVGRNDRENDEITFKIANGRDLWLHARDYPGSHAVVRLPKGVEPSRSTLVEAAMIALHYSKAAKAGKGEVTYAFVKNIRRPKGAPPGKVLVHKGKSVFVRIDPDKIKRMKVEP